MLEGGFITQPQLANAKTASSTTRSSFLDCLVSHGMLNQETLITVLSFQLRLPVVDLRHVAVDPEAAGLISGEYARQHGVIPLAFDDDRSLRIATRTPHDFQQSSDLTPELSDTLGYRIKFYLTVGGDLNELIDSFYSTETPPRQRLIPAENNSQASKYDGEYAFPDLNFSELTDVQMMELVTLQAIEMNASDVHLVPKHDSAKVLYRLNGELRQMMVIPLTAHESMVARFKEEAGMDLSGNQRPQNGGFGLYYDEWQGDFRVASVGTAWGEMMVVHVLDRSNAPLSLDSLGMDAPSLKSWHSLLERPSGMLLVAGPTGSGKSTTLYASLAELISSHVNIMSVEDPIEYRMDSVNQIQVNPAAGIDFPSGLGSIMRLDPDVILIGEIRDNATATIAIDAALSGRLVLASIHGNDAASAIGRLINFGVDPLLAANGLIGCLAQRALNQICPKCSQAAPPEPSLASGTPVDAKAPRFMIGRGCSHCSESGFVGQDRVFEVLAIDENIQMQIGQGVSGEIIRDTAVRNGMVTMGRSVMEMARTGRTTLSEVSRSGVPLD